MKKPYLSQTDRENILNNTYFGAIAKSNYEFQKASKQAYKEGGCLLRYFIRKQMINYFNYKLNNRYDTSK